MQNLPKWAWALIIIPVIGVIAGFYGYQVNQVNKTDDKKNITPVNQDVEFQEINITVQNKRDSTFIRDVEVRIQSDGPPTLKKTDSNGFFQIRIPTRKVATITLTKKYFKTENYSVNLQVDQNTTKTFYMEPEESPIPTPTLENPSTSTPLNSPELLQSDLTKLNCAPSLPVTNGYPVAISKQTFKSMIYMVYGLKITCSLKNNSDRKQFTHLSLAFGISDSNYCPVPSSVALYLDRQKVGEYKLLPGDLKNRNLDITNKGNFSIDFVGQPCSSDGGVHFVKATLN